MSFTRSDFSIAIFHALDNHNPHPWMVKYLAAWTQIETTGLGNPYALHNLLNTTQQGYGCDLLPEWNSVHVRQYPTFEDGVAATAACLQAGPIHYYTFLLSCLQKNDGLPLGAVGDPDPEIVKELNSWSGNANYARTIAELANSSDLRLNEEFEGRHAGQP